MDATWIGYKLDTIKGASCIFYSNINIISLFILWFRLRVNIISFILSVPEDKLYGLAGETGLNIVVDRTICFNIILDNVDDK